MDKAAGMERGSQQATALVSKVSSHIMHAACCMHVKRYTYRAVGHIAVLFKSILDFQQAGTGAVPLVMKCRRAKQLG